MSLLISTGVRARLGLESEAVDGSGRVTVPSFTAARRVALALGRGEIAAGDARAFLSAGDVVAFAVLDDIFRALLARYVRRRDAGVLSRAFEQLAERLDGRRVADELESFRRAFALRSLQPASLAVGTAAGSRSRTPRVDDRLVLEFVLFWLQRRNPAASRLAASLHEGYPISPIVERMFVELDRFFATCGGLVGENLGEELLAPFRAHPDSLAGQLEFLRRSWGDELEVDGWRLQSALDLIAEESAPRWGPESGPSVQAPRLPADSEKNYAVDREWMPGLVLAAKNTLVWLHQLSLAYGREIRHLDEIPDEELGLLAGRGITGLWLIGLWERSPASSEIKRRRGNPEAAASAYSLSAYRIADEFGGDGALDRLRQRAARHGLRLAADMVPNHMGIDSEWVLDHPERFVQVPQPPFPAYTFNGPDLSPRRDVGIFIEDHYYDGTDAAVVFKRLDKRTGESRFIYHGNDGTSTPWNDTAQLDYLDAEVREAVIQTILEVARRFPVIRFDAAMTLAKRHYHRLWHPRPGDAGAIPSRSEHSLSRERFDERMPREFWREVVDRVAAEVPETLLLAEAFWLMEGYFVRTLGLHRVYNSAFMHMMRDRQTGKFRRLLKETLAFDPEILRRYVNFMSNPDEESAADQFGLGDRYFGVCSVLATLPGLPMLAHGQWDGLREKYGMEYRRSYREERPLREVIERHDREIAPLLARRGSFAGVERFRLYDFVDSSGRVIEDVIAYSNGEPDEAALVVFNNSDVSVQGRLWQSAPFRRSIAGGVSEARAQDEIPTSTTLAEALPLGPQGAGVNCLRDPIRGLHILGRAEDLAATGLEISLDPDATLVLSEVLTLDDRDGRWRDLAATLGGRPVADPAMEMMAFRAGPLEASLARFTEMSGLSGVEHGSADDLVSQPVLDELDREARAFLSGPPFPADLDSGRCRNLLNGLARASGEAPHPSEPLPRAGLLEIVDRWPVLRWVLAVSPVTAALEAATTEGLIPALETVLTGRAPFDPETRSDLESLLRVARRDGWLDPQPPPGVSGIRSLVEHWSKDADVRSLLGVHSADDSTWIVKEKLELLLAARRAFAVAVEFASGGDGGANELVMVGLGWRLAADAISRAAAETGYRFDAWRDSVRALDARAARSDGIGADRAG